MIALYSLPRSKSTVLFDSLAVLAASLGMEVHVPQNGEYYYLNNNKPNPKLFAKIDSRTDVKPIVDAQKDHHWFITTRNFQDFCLSFAYAYQTNEWHSKFAQQIKEWRMYRSTYEHCKEMYEQHLQNIEYIKEHANYTIIDYTEIVDNWRMRTYEWVPSEKDYIGAMDNYEEFRDWQRIDHIQSLEKIRTWNCYSSFTQGNLHEHELFNDLVEEKCHMWYNIYEPGDSQDWHDHLSPEVVKSGIRFLTDPKGIEFENKDIQIQKQIEFDPSERHRVNPTDHFRISIAYNITK